MFCAHQFNNATIQTKSNGINGSSQPKKQTTDVIISHNTCADPEGGQVVQTPPPMKNHKNIGFLSKFGPDPMKNHQATKPAFNVGLSSARQQNAI